MRIDGNGKYTNLPISNNSHPAKHLLAKTTIPLRFIHTFSLDKCKTDPIPNYQKVRGGDPLITAECESALKFVYIQIAYDSN